jgi:group I intron endonuclease
MTKITGSRIYGRIYVVTNAVNGKKYVGQTTLITTQRWAKHMSSARSTINHCRALGCAILKYGSENFTVEEVATAHSKEGLDAKEIHWVNLCNSVSPHGYNLTEGGGSAGRPSKETIELRRNAMLGHPVSQATRDKIRMAQVGKQLTPEHREKLRQAKLGRKQDAGLVARRTAAIRAVYLEKHDEIVAKITSVHLGTHHSEATKEKMRVAARNRRAP